MPFWKQRKVAVDGERNGFEPEAVLDEVDRVLRSATFSATQKRRKMLTFIVEETLAGRGDTLKGYAIGLAVFDRDDTFDPQSDPIVRLEARRLRHDLDSYYVSEGAHNAMRISIPKGQYAARFHFPEKKASSAGAATESEQEVPEGAAIEPVGNASDKRMLLPWGIAAASAVLALLATGVSMFPEILPVGKAGGALGKPSVMVLPFEDETANADQRLLATGISDQIMTALSRFPDIGLFLPPANAAGQPPPDPVKVGKQEGVSYLIAGSVAADGEQVRVNAKLVETGTKRVLWSGNYDRQRSQASLLEIEQGIAGEIASIIGQPYGIIKTELANRLPSAIEPHASSFDCVLRGYVYRRNFSAQLHAQVLGCLEEAVKRDPTYAEAWAMLGWLYLDAARFGFAPDADRELGFDRALTAASHALTLEGNNVLALKAMSSANHYMGNIREGERFARQALAVNPNDPDTLAQLGWRLAVVGNFKEGIPFLQKAIERTANAPGWYYHLIAIDHLLNGRYAEMLTAAKKGGADNSGVSWALIAIAQSELGNSEAAGAALAQMAEASPSINRDPAAFLRRHQAKDRIVDAMVNGLTKAGWHAPAN